ncbi:hypothetical protein F5Y15DRAFT_424264 [Xylariaceae sp. FL0016]|nr:hypothetical protein F5Y15DRAFT_424264 [Xylariaceae sp. FL0016]
MGFPKRNSNPPPQYAVNGDGGSPAGNVAFEPTDDLTSAFASLDLPPIAGDVDANTCLAHLKLLFAFQNLKDEVGYTDGLWQIYDSRALSSHEAKSQVVEKGLKLEDETAQKLAMVREKRWALYVARAVDRYEAWWNTFATDPLAEWDMEAKKPQQKYILFTSQPPLSWTEMMLPPLDVLMVWHAHMLNPQNYLEDCMRYGYSGLWTAGLPWQLVNGAIDTSFNYKPSADCVAAWEVLTDRKWDNSDDTSTKALKCPICRKQQSVPWTTCGMPEGVTEQVPGLVGQGFGDGRFTFSCVDCQGTIDKDVLEVAKFIRHTEGLLAYSRPMPGTILQYDTGRPEVVPSTSPESERYPRTFPNRLITKHLRIQILELLNSPAVWKPVSMDAIRELIEGALEDASTIKKIEGVKGRDALRNYRLGQASRVHTRKMMSRYWGNATPFALELGGAVLRQGIFTEKMYKIDWLHSPAARETMARVVVKYERFTEIMAKNPRNMAVPTLDVDLAWHTHQLSPASYYDWMYSKTRKFIDHDDKVDEDKLSGAFEWTSKTYQEMYGEVYSECTCWYCETVRVGHVSSAAKVLGLSKNEKVSDAFYDSGRAKLCPPDNSAHISAHNSIQLVHPDPQRQRVHDRLHRIHITRLDDTYAKAQKRAKKKGRELPPRDEYYNYYWGYPYMMYGPWVYPPFYAPIYYGDPGAAAAGSGSAGACATGTCSGGAGAGACGGPAAGGCGGSGGCGGGAGCGSSSGPGCGGGGGGGGGGCGGSGGGGGGCGGGGGG